MYDGQDLYHKFGDPRKESHMVLWHVPTDFETGVIPRRIYCHKLMVPALSEAFCNLITRGYVDELKTWDGCFNIRPIRGYEQYYEELMASGEVELAMAYLSTHAWGLAIDVNAAWNGLGKPPTLSAGFVKCFTDAGLEWGGTWQRRDGMHFQLQTISEAGS